MNKKLIAAALALAVVSFTVGRFSAPLSSKSKEKVETHESQEQEKNQNVTETEKETKFPDGTVVKEKTKTKITQTETKKENDKVSEKSESNLRAVGEWRMSVDYEPAVKGFQPERYTGIVERRILSEIFGGVSVSSEKTVGLVLSISF